MNNDIIKNFTREDYENSLVNLHIHSTFSDGKADVEDIIRQAKENGYKKIAICDHNTLDAHKCYKDDILIPAVEFDVWIGYVFCHVLAYNINPFDERIQKFCAKSKRETEWDIVRIFAKRDIVKLVEVIHSCGGIVVLAHPACCWAVNIEHFVKKLIKLGFDGLEVYYPYKRHRGIVRFHKISTFEKLAEKYNLIKTGGTDLHDKFL